MKYRSFGNILGCPEPTAVSFNDRPADTEAHTSAVLLGCEESVENLPGLIRREPDSIILD